jgi:hypothetical protein
MRFRSGGSAAQPRRFVRSQPATLSEMRVLLTRLFAPWAARQATIAVVLAGIALFIALDRSRLMSNPEWRIDEGQRIAESYVLRLVQAGEFGHPDLFRYVTDSSHPQMNKYFFGLALHLAGVELPRDLALPRYYESGGLQRTGAAPPPHLRATFEPMLQPARRAALLCNVLSAMVVLWLLLRWCGAGAALIAVFVLARHYLAASYVVYARSDALQTCAMTLTLLPVAAMWRNPRSRLAFGAALLAGVFSAICFQTRLNGLLALGAAGFVLIVLAARTRDLRPLLLAAIMVIVCGVVSIASNPYYWAEPSPPDAVPEVYRQSEPLPLRVITRFRVQIAELQLLLREAEGWELPSIADRARFVARVLFSGLAGIAILFGLLAGAVAAFFRRSSTDVLAWSWGIPLILVFTLWIPLSWDPYVLLIFPTVVLLSAMGASRPVSLWLQRRDAAS